MCGAMALRSRENEASGRLRAHRRFEHRPNMASPSQHSASQQGATQHGAPGSSRDGSARLLAVVALILAGTAWTVASFLESDAVVQAAPSEGVESAPGLGAEEFELHRNPAFDWSGVDRRAVGPVRSRAQGRPVLRAVRPSTSRQG